MGCKRGKTAKWEKWKWLKLMLAALQPLVYEEHTWESCPWGGISLSYKHMMALAGGQLCYSKQRHGKHRPGWGASTHNTLSTAGGQLLVHNCPCFHFKEMETQSGRSQHELSDLSRNAFVAKLVWFTLKLIRVNKTTHSWNFMSQFLSCPGLSVSQRGAGTSDLMLFQCLHDVYIRVYSVWDRDGLKSCLNSRKCRGSGKVALLRDAGLGQGV